MPNERKTIEVDGRTLAYELCRNARAKWISIRIHPGPEESGRVVLTVPKRASIRHAEEFLKTHFVWVAEQAKKLAGKESVLSRTDTREYRRRRTEAESFIRDKVTKWNDHYGFHHGRISIRDQKTRWGSCSKKGNLSFSWKLLLLPERMADYVVVHELCHLKEFNHSSRFWALVAQTIPDCRHIAKELRKG
jgi:predicted metal-dependent hydrolase